VVGAAQAEFANTGKWRNFLQQCSPPTVAITWFWTFAKGWTPVQQRKIKHSTAYVRIHKSRYGAEDIGKEMLTWHTRSVYAVDLGCKYTRLRMSALCEKWVFTCTRRDECPVSIRQEARRAGHWKSKVCTTHTGNGTPDVRSESSRCTLSCIEYELLYFRVSLWDRECSYGVG
jgi:hypothetical protein